ncbi:MAG TPA: N-acetylmuramoyl-L-alanine amidase [Candidatus Omnitrophota bacterium]|nr:N-acetylmuramoyl-L-alanine amidase [Candidatus Omnitrophota bacterium]
MKILNPFNTARKSLPACFAIFLTCVLCSCGTIPPRPSPQPPPSAPRANRTHTVAPGETLWRISKIYNVPMASIINVNRLKDTQPLEMGQILNIPSASSPQQVLSLFPSGRWKYIIVHHSATQEGSSLQFHRHQQEKGWDSVGYHFVIDNGKSGKPDGFIEITPRWLKQQHGAHCKASDMNTVGIGICLVGNFNEREVSPAQMNALVYLVNELRRYYKIPKNNILGHRHVPGSKTDCPGNRFPWDKFKRQIQ